jgi:trehalose synthase
MLTDVALKARSLETLRPFLPVDDDGRFETVLAATAESLDGRTVWNVNSTAEGGGVAEILHSLLPYLQDAGWKVRWVVMDGDEDFFELTKGLHHALHGVPPAEDIWQDFERLYSANTERNASELLEQARPGDVALVHDPQAAGLVHALSRAGVHVSWQCHIGTDVPNECTRAAWDRLRPYVESADRYVFSRDAYLWEGLDTERLRVIPPAIDAFSPKNEQMTGAQVQTILRGSGVLADGPRSIPDDAGLVVQVSRWDRLKDPIGYIRMFVDHLADIEDLHAVYAGPATGAVDDDPEGAEVHAACEEVWRSLPDDIRDRVHLLSVPMDDPDENAKIINALQRRADVVVQKSLQEGFGLTVAEAMWKSRPVVGSRVGGIQDQIEDGRSGLLVDDPYDLAGFARAVRALVEDREHARGLGEAAHERVQEHYLAPRLLSQYAGLVAELIGAAS